MADLSAIMARLVALGKDMLGTSNCDFAYPATLTGHLPFLLFSEDESSYSKLDSNRYQVTREYIGLLYVQAYKDDISSQKESARAAARPYLVSYPSYFLARSRLQHDDQGIADITKATVSADSGIQSGSRDQVIFTCVFCRHLVTYELFITEV